MSTAIAIKRSYKSKNCTWLLRSLVVVLVFASLGADAQSGPRRFSAKAHLGGFGSQVGGDGLSGFDKLNVGAGIGVSTPVGESLNLEMELNLAQKGSKKRTDPDNYGEDQYKMDLWYVQVPVVLEYRLNERFGGNAGLAAGALIASKESDFFGEIENHPEFNALDLSLVLGARYHFNDNWMAELRFDQSLVPIRSRGDHLPLRIQGHQFNTVLGVFLSYYFR